MNFIGRYCSVLFFLVLISPVVAAKSDERAIQEIIKAQEPDIRYPTFTHFDCVSLLAKLNNAPTNKLGAERMQILDSLLKSMVSDQSLVTGLVRDAVQNETIVVSIIEGFESIEVFLNEWSIASHEYRREWVRQWHYKDGTGKSPVVDWDSVFAEAQKKPRSYFSRILFSLNLLLVGYFGAIAARVNAQRVLLPDYLKEILRAPGYVGYGLIRHPKRIRPSIFKGLQFKDKRALAVLTEIGSVPVLILIQEV